MDRKRRAVASKLTLFADDLMSKVKSWWSLSFLFKVRQNSFCVLKIPYRSLRSPVSPKHSALLGEKAIDRDTILSGNVSSAVKKRLKKNKTQLKLAASSNWISRWILLFLIINYLSTTFHLHNLTYKLTANIKKKTIKYFCSCATGLITSLDWICSG